jgi:hypothetical protein
VSFSGPEAPWTVPAPPGEPIPMWMVIAAALAYTTYDIRERIDTGDCGDCGVLLCADHRADAGFAAACQAVYAQVAAGSPEWADLAISLEAGMN